MVRLLFLELDELSYEYVSTMRGRRYYTPTRSVTTLQRRADPLRKH